MHSGMLRNGYTTGTCATAASLASVIWQTTGTIPDSVEVLLQSGEKLRLEIQNVQEIPEMQDSKKYGKFSCGVIKDAGDDIDITNHCLVIASVRILAHDGDVKFSAGEGVGLVTRKGLKIPAGEPAINPVPRAMITKAIRSVIGTKAAYVKISIPDGEKLAEKTFNPRLGIQNGLSILGTTGIVRPMSQDAIKESLRLELSMCRAEFGTTCAFVTGYAGENYLKKYKKNNIILCSNYLGYLLDCAEELGFENLLILGRTGKLTKPAANIMDLHSHTAGGQREVVCTHAALAGADLALIRKLYHAATTAQMQELLKNDALDKLVWHSVAEAGAENCELRTHGKIRIAMVLLDEQNQILAETKNTGQIMKAWLEN